eukprot:SAG11_NODE_2232_length_3656_cov_3.028957_4_plen_491_part_00
MRWNAAACAVLSLAVAPDTPQDTCIDVAGSERAADCAAAAGPPLPCNIERRAVCKRKKRKNSKKKSADSCITAEEFEELYFNKQPILLDGLTDGWAAREHWASTAAFVARHGEMSVGLTDGPELVFGGPEAVARHMPLREAMATMEADPDAFLFMGGQHWPSNSSLLADFQTPEWSVLRGFSPAPGMAMTDVGKERSTSGSGLNSWHMLSVGGPNSGLPWHLHGQTWIALLSGRKRWFVTPPEGLPGREEMRGQPLQMAAAWAAATYPRMLEAQKAAGGVLPLRECVQRPGELFYLPTGWNHLTLNLETTVAVGAQSAFNGKAELALVKQGAVAGNPDAQQVFGEMLHSRNDFVAAEDLMKRASWHPLSARARLGLVDVWIDWSSKERRGGAGGPPHTSKLPKRLLRGLARDGAALRNASKAAKRDYGAVVAAVSQNGSALAFASAALRADRELQLLATARLHLDESAALLHKYGEDGGANSPALLGRAW